MKVYNQNKTQILDEYDLNLGYLKPDKITNVIPAQAEVKEQGHYNTIAEYSNGGKDVEWVVDVEYQPAVDEHIENEEISVYIPYTDKELKEIKLSQLRAKREPLLKAFDIYKSNVNYGIVIEDEAEHINVINWYNDILDLKEKAINNVPISIQKYIHMI